MYSVHTREAVSIEFELFIAAVVRYCVYDQCLEHNKKREGRHFTIP